MASSVAIQERMVNREIDSFSFTFESLNFENEQPSGTKPLAWIVCNNKTERVADIFFYNRQPPPLNTYRGSDPHYTFYINFHISKFNDIINILRYHTNLSITFDLVRKDGALDCNAQATGMLAPAV